MELMPSSEAYMLQMPSMPQALAPALSPYLLVEDVAARLRCSCRTIHELTRTCAIPYRRLPGGRRCLFREDELEAWEGGAPLEVIETAGGGRVVRPKVG